MLEISPRNFDDAKLKKAFRGQSKKWHPDKNPGIDTSEKFMEIKLASDILSSPFLKTGYDLFLQTKFEQEDKLYQ